MDTQKMVKNVGNWREVGECSIFSFIVLYLVMSKCVSMHPSILC
jgi:hypothetical protein